MKKELFKVGIIGYGKMGKIRHREIDAYKMSEVVCIYDQFDVETKLQVAKSAEDLIINFDLDAIFICTANYMNKSLTIAALKSGKHVFCEKPPSFNADELLSIRKVEIKTKRKLMYGLNHRHHDSIKKMKQLIDSKQFGSVLWMRGRYGKSVDQTFFDTWRSKRKYAGGGILLDQGIHMLDLFLYLGGGFDEVKAVVSNRYWNLDVEDNVFAIYKNSETGLVASLHSTMTQWRHLFSLEIFLDKGYMVLNGLKTSSGTYGDEVLTVARNRTSAPAATWEDEEHITFHIDNSWQSEVRHFFNAIKNDTQITIGNSSEVLSVMELIDMTYKDGGIE